MRALGPYLYYANSCWFLASKFNRAAPRYAAGPDVGIAPEAASRGSYRTSSFSSAMAACIFRSCDVTSSRGAKGDDFDAVLTKLP